MNEKIYRRVLRRETHRARTTLAIIVAIIALALAVAGAWLGVDASSRTDLRETLSAWHPALIASIAAIVCAIIALVLLLAGILPGRRHRRALTVGRIGIVLDDVVIANGVADRVAHDCLMARTQIRAFVDRRRVIVTVTPTSGVAVDEAAVLEAARAALADAHIQLRPTVRISDRGVIA